MVIKAGWNKISRNRVILKIGGQVVQKWHEIDYGLFRLKGSHQLTFGKCIGVRCGSGGRCAVADDPQFLNLLFVERWPVVVNYTFYVITGKRAVPFFAFGGNRNDFPWALADFKADIRFLGSQ
jgi:hypothetical protein